MTKPVHLSRSAAVGQRVLLLAGIWLVMTAGELDSWLLGGPLILLLALLAPPEPPLRGLRWRALPVFALFMLRGIILGALQASWLALGPASALRPGLVRLPLRLKTEPARILMVATTSLIPGTLSADLEEGELVIHALDTSQPVYASARQLEERVAALFVEEFR